MALHAGRATRGTRTILLAVVVLLGSAAPAVADGGWLLVDVPGHGTAFTRHLSGAVIDAMHLAPGYTATGDFSVRNASSHRASLVLATYDVRDAENRCLPQEAREAGEDCSAGGGELSRSLVAKIVRVDHTRQVTLQEGRLTALAAGVVLSDDLPAGSTWPLRMAVTLPQSVGNEVMTDTTSFGLRLTAASLVGTSGVDGGQVQAGTPAHTSAAAVGPGTGRLGPLTTGPRVELPMTGASIGLWALLLDLIVLVAGGALLWVARHARTSRPPARGGGSHAARGPQASGR